eukprot:4551456-Prymnesium_polylepis.1
MRCLRSGSLLMIARPLGHLSSGCAASRPLSSLAAMDSGAGRAVRGNSGGRLDGPPAEWRPSARTGCPSGNCGAVPRRS